MIAALVEACRALLGTDEVELIGEGVTRSSPFRGVSAATLARVEQQTATSGEVGTINDSEARMILVIPVRVRGRTEMFVCAVRESPAVRFSGADSRIASTLSALAGAALENEASYSELRATDEELRAAVARLRDTQDQVAAVDRLATIGRVGAALVQELSEPVRRMRSAAARVQRAGESLPPAQREELDVVRAAVARMDRIVENVARVARGGPPTVECFDPADSVEDAAMLLRRQLAARSIELEWTPEQDPQRRVVGDRNRVQQLVMNLLVNARDELEDCPDGSPRRIVIRCDRSGTHVLLSVRDSGRGIPESLRERLFEPFVTDKPKGRGLGLGLSVSAQIADEHGGRLLLASGGGPGARFELLLPLAR